MLPRPNNLPPGMEMSERWAAERWMQKQMEWWRMIEQPAVEFREVELDGGLRAGQTLLVPRQAEQVEIIARFNGGHWHEVYKQKADGTWKCARSEKRVG